MFMSVSKDFKNKVKRKRVDWYLVMLDENDPGVLGKFYELRTRHPFMSFNRCAYNALRNYHSTTAMQRFRFTGSWL